MSCGTCGIGHACRAEFSLLVGPRGPWIAWAGVLVKSPESALGREYIGPEGIVQMECLVPAGQHPLVGVSPDAGLVIEAELLRSWEAEVNSKSQF